MTSELQAKVLGAFEYRVVRLLSDEGARSLAEEAWTCMGRAGSLRSTDLAPDDREGERDQWIDTAQGGPCLAAFIHAPETLEILHGLTACRWVPRGSAPGFIYYRRAGHFIGLHRDVAACELSVLTCVDDQAGPGGDLLLYPRRASERLSVIRATPETGCVRLRLEAGDSLVTIGRQIPHCVTPVGAGRTRITAAVCYLRCG